MHRRLVGHTHHAGGGGAQRRGPYKWSFDRLREELAEYLGDRPDWPTADELRTAGRHDLLNAVNRMGGAGVWAKEMGRSFGSMQDRSPYSQGAALRDAAALIDRFGRVPNAVRLRQLGYSRLAYVSRRPGGARAFSRQHGLPY